MAALNTNFTIDFVLAILKRVANSTNAPIYPTFCARHS